MNENVINVGQLNFYVRSLVEGDPRLLNVYVCGEISNFKNHFSSGHWYFTLKDAAASVKCVMFRSANQRVRINPEDGIKVIVRGRASLYEKDGQFQFYAEEMVLFGQGDINADFERIKEKLSKEGLFDTYSKRSIPKYPKRIAVVTSDTGAAIQDITNILFRRWPLVEIVMCPVLVQGEEAVKSMLNTLERVYTVPSIDVIIIGRGGGSAEDLWAFNSEQLARKIYEAPVPVISAVGHETDFTICDFVADLRAPTPSAAAELAVPDIKEISVLLEKSQLSLKRSLNYSYTMSLNKLKSLINSLYFKNPVDYIINKRFQQVDLLLEQLKSLMNEKINCNKLSLAQSSSRLDGLSPLKSLSRGFTAVSKNGKSITAVDELSVDESITLSFIDGKAECSVNNIERKVDNG